MTHDDVWHVLPWFVNGALRGKMRADVDSHLSTCVDCRSEVAMQAHVRDAIAREDVRQESEQSSFDQLWGKIQEHEGLVSQASAESPAAAPARTVAARAQNFGMMKWLVAAVIIEGVGLAAMSMMMWNNSTDVAPPADYRTLSTPAASLPGGQIRAVFAPELGLKDLQALLSTSQLGIVGGPSEAGVYTLALTNADGSVDSALAGLRRSASVRFAEPIDTARATPQ